MKKVKCGIITIHDIPNYGATFQAYGLLEYIKKNYSFVQAEIINYHMNQSDSIENSKNGYKEKNRIKYYYNKARNFKRFFGIRKREKSFRIFQNNHYSLSEHRYSGDDEILNNIPQYSIYITGSDQLFNLQLTNKSLAYFLVGFPNYKISYSTSFGMNGLDENSTDEIITYLKDYNGISVRELSANKALNKLGFNSSVTADPVFLLDKQQWISLEKPVRTPSKYIFCYLMSDNPNIYSALDWIKDKDNIPVIVLHTFKGKLNVKCKYLDYCSPGELLYLIKNATYVLTNSFHGCALSIIYGKKVFSLEEENYIGDQRYAALFKNAKIDGKVVPYNTEWKDFNFSEHLIDGQLAFENIIKWVEESKEYLNYHFQRVLEKNEQ